jgi:hypothetical protein
LVEYRQRSLDQHLEDEAMLEETTTEFPRGGWLSVLSALLFGA